MNKIKIKKFKFFFFIICIIQLFYLFYFRSGFQYEIIKNPFSKNSGIFYALPQEAIESNNILKKHKATDFNLSKGLKKDIYLYQRSIEFNYPIRINENSRLIFFHVDEDIPNACTVIETGKYLKFTQC